MLGDGGRRTQIRAVNARTVLGRPEPGKHRHVRRQGPRGGRTRHLERDPLFRPLFNLRRGGSVVSINTHVIGAESIRDDPDHVRRAWRRLLTRHARARWRPSATAIAYRREVCRPPRSLAGKPCAARRPSARPAGVDNECRRPGRATPTPPGATHGSFAMGRATAACPGSLRPGPTSTTSRWTGTCCLCRHAAQASAGAMSTRVKLADSSVEVTTTIQPACRLIVRLLQSTRCNP